MREGQKIGQARRLRRTMTRAEKLLWWKLRGGAQGWKFRRQVPVGPFIVDFACIEARLAIEIDGATHHTDLQIAQDARRTAALEAEDWRVARFWNREVFDNLDGVVASIRHAADEHADWLQSRRL